ncbi:unnamed protein product [Spirodela intermedia]|uniref:Uncharacterized protein n=2 Tax=Spirodela intermedia TaxID=51605 RepID=A0A7I8IV57_SPIIN|nr:unnamed protein product [Spirodela intermedia]CAA6661453.1 unnamed protein product [Spirodela intermedia]CAA7397813.1 unnamed protein product [Spirodela intermedia]
MLRLRSLSLMVVQRHTAASSSRSPPRMGQQWFAAGSPTLTLTSPPRRSTQAPIFRESTGQESGAAGGGGQGAVGGVTTGGGRTGGTTTGESVGAWSEGGRWGSWGF